MRINHNIAALNTYRQLSINNTNSSKAIEKLSSGLRINRAGDDAAGLAISEKMRGQIRGLEMASRNAQDGISLIQTAEGALNEIHSILQRMRELAVQAANDTNDDTDRGKLQEEVDALIDELNRIAERTEFNGMTLLDGSLGVGFSGDITNATYVESIKLITAGNLEVGNELTITQTVTHAAAGDGGAFQKIEFTLQIEEGDTKTVSFTKAELEAGTISKEEDLDNGVKVEVNVKDIAALLVSEGDGEGETTAADSLTFADNSLIFHIGANAGQNLSLGIGNMKASALGTTDANGIVTASIADIDITSQSSANDAITTIQNAVDMVSTQRSQLGAAQNRLEHTIANLGTAAENLTAAESRIRDVDMAKEIMEFTKTAILTQAAQAMLAQANQQPQGVLQLLQ